MYNRYHGNTGRVERVAEPGAQSVPQPKAQTLHPAAPPQEERRPPGPLSGLSGEFGRLLRRLSPTELETEDFLLICILYLLYRESGDEEFLFAIGGMLLL